MLKNQSTREVKGLICHHPYLYVWRLQFWYGKKIGANDFVPKFDANEFTYVVLHSLKKVAQGIRGSDAEFNVSSVEELKESHHKDDMD